MGALWHPASHWLSQQETVDLLSRRDSPVDAYAISRIPVRDLRGMGGFVKLVLVNRSSPNYHREKVRLARFAVRGSKEIDSFLSLAKRQGLVVRRNDGETTDRQPYSLYFLSWPPKNYGRFRH